MSARSPRFDEDDYETIRNELQGKLLSSLNTENKRDQLIATSWNLLENAFHIELKRYQDTVNMLKKKLATTPRDPEESEESTEEPEKPDADALLAEIEKLKKQLSICKEELQLKTDELEAMNKQFGQLNTEHASLLADSETQNKDSTTAIQNMTNTLAEQNKEFEKIEKEKNQLKKELKQTKETLEGLYPIQSEYDTVDGMHVVRWVPDDIVDKCEDCKQAFGLANRKHHCRNCGRIICGNCSTSRKDFKYYKNKSSCICKKCDSKLAQ